VLLRIDFYPKDAAGDDHDDHHMMIAITRRGGAIPDQQEGRPETVGRQG
jgi:hypothetical protein